METFYVRNFTTERVRKIWNGDLYHHPCSLSFKYVLIIIIVIIIIMIIIIIIIIIKVYLS
jgi:hypothetical protein